MISSHVHISVHTVNFSAKTTYVSISPQEVFLHWHGETIVVFFLFFLARKNKSWARTPWLGMVSIHPNPSQSPLSLLLLLLLFLPVRLRAMLCSLVHKRQAKLTRLKPQPNQRSSRRQSNARSQRTLALDQSLSCRIQAGKQAGGRAGGRIGLNQICVIGHRHI